jgi:hypothetical protein
MNKQNDGIRLVLPSDIDPLIDSADAQLVGFLDALRGNDMVQIGDDSAVLVMAAGGIVGGGMSTADGGHHHREQVTSHPGSYGLLR